MTREEQNLLLIDLSSRLPYGVKLNCCGTHGVVLQSIDSNGLINNDYDIDEVKPYLFPMSSIINEKGKNYINTCTEETNGWRYPDTIKSLDWFNKNRVDYRNLIGKNLAIDCTNLNIY